MKKIFAFALAIALVLAMVPATALADGETVTITTAAELEAAIANQAPGQTWNIAAGVYDIGRNATITAGGQTGWYFPIVEDGITIIGAGIDQTVITSTEFSTNGNWSSQDMLAVWGDNVTIQNMTIKPKMDTNKAIEVMGMNFTAQNVAIRNNDVLSHEDYCAQKGIAMDSSSDSWQGYRYWFGGSVYFNPQNTDKDIGTATLDNVLVTRAWISCNTSSVYAGTLDLLNGTTIDFRNCWYAGYRPDIYGVISKNPNVINAVDFTVIYDDLADEQLQVFNRVPLGTTLIKGSGTEVTAAVDSTYTIIIPASVNFGTLVKDSGVFTQEFDVTAQGVVIEDDASIDVSVVGPFTMMDHDGMGTVPLGFALSNETGVIPAAGGTFASFTGSATEDGTVSVDTAAITAAGSYSGTMVFTITYND